MDTTSSQDDLKDENDATRDTMDPKTSSSGACTSEQEQVGSGDNELSALGVSVYSQQEFEEGVMKKLDEQATRHSNQQAQMFAERELTDIQRAIRITKGQISQLSQTLTSLLCKPLCDVIQTVKQTKANQEEKRLQLKKLEDKERDLKNKLKTGAYSSLPEGSSTVQDVMFGITGGTDEEEKQRLIRIGLLTPFGGSSDSARVGPSSETPSTNSKLPTPTNKSMSEFDWLGIPPVSTPTTSTGKGKGSAKKSKRPLAKGKTLASTPSCSKNGDQDSAQNESESRDSPFILGSDEESSSYYTDEELGGDTGGKQKKKRRRVREVSSCSSEEDELMEEGRIKRRRKSGRAIDDGDEEMYKMRIRQHRRESGAGDQTAPVQLGGGYQVPGKIWHKLYRYQQTGVKWLWELHCQQVGGVIGDEMGLGKTIQMIAFLAGLQISNLRSHITRKLGLGPVLIVCPATVLHQWVSEFHLWWPSFRVAVLHDSGSFSGTRKQLVSSIATASGVLVTTFASIRIHNQLLLQQQWDYVVLDEGHKIRNPDSEITISCKQFSTPHRIILSGSPVQNNLKELWSLFDFVFPGKLGTLPVFMEQFSVPITLGGYANASQIQVQTAYKCACILRDTINPYLLRRLKADVKLYLPNKNEQVLFCQLTDYQRELYEDYIRGPEVESMLSGRQWVFSGLTKLRKLCNHPDLVTKEFSQQNIDREKEEEEEGEEEGGLLLDIPQQLKRKKGDSVDDDEGFGYWRRSGKLVVVEALLRMWMKQDHRVLLFSQSKMMLTVFERFVVSQGYSYMRMDGTTPISTRQPLINRFNEDPSVFVFLLTTRVGGIGVNLTGADRVIIYDPDWNPSTDIQARERVWRIGQTRPVTVYRLLTSGTIEEKIYHRQIFKQFLTNRVLRDPRQRRFFKSNDLYELFTLGPAGRAHETETDAIFAGTGSQVVMPRRPKKKSGRKRRRESIACDGEEEESEPPLLHKAEQRAGEGEASGGGEQSCSSQTREKHKKSKRDKKERRKRRRKNAELEGERITGLDNSSVYQPGSGDEEEATSSKQDDHILRTLFKKSGVHSALQHDTIINSGDPDYALVEAEGDKIAQSAARVLKESRRHCQSQTRWGTPTWTGQSGKAGAPRFGDSSKSSSSEGVPGTLNLSSSVLLAKMRSRNTHTLDSSVHTIHSSSDADLMSDLRSFIAHQGQQDGQATTDEILTHFKSQLSPSQSAMFRSMLRQLCDFSRSHGEGVWYLKAEFR